MSIPYRTQGIVLRRTKLGETNLVVTFLCADAEGGATVQVRAVAKGARRPGSRLAGVVDLGNEAELLLHPGRTLDTVSEARLVTSRAGLACDIGRSSMAAALLDVACELTAEGGHDARLYPLTATALDTLSDVPEERLGLTGAAYAFKAAAMEGYRPALDACVLCGGEIDVAGAASRGERLVLSLEEGGVVCPACCGARCGRPVGAVVLAWVQTLLVMRFADLRAMAPVPGERALGGDLLELARSWLSYYPGVRPRALDFVLGGMGW